MSSFKLATESIALKASSVSANADNDAWQVPSPCNATCIMDADTGWCQGCWRTLDEIRLWGNADQDDKRAIWARIGQRHAQAS